MKHLGVRRAGRHHAGRHAARAGRRMQHGPRGAGAHLTLNINPGQGAMQRALAAACAWARGSRCKNTCITALVCLTFCARTCLRSSSDCLEEDIKHKVNKMWM